jgi:RNA-directed DNA polymerase
MLAGVDPVGLHRHSADRRLHVPSHSQGANGPASMPIRSKVSPVALRCLRRRSQRHRLTWRKMMRIAERWLPSRKLRHPYPDWRFDVMTRGGSPVR